MSRGVVGATLAFGEDAERMVRLRHVRVETPGPLAEQPRALEVAALELDQAEIDERLDEVRAVFERDAQPSVCGLEVTLLERLHPRGIERGSLRWQRSTGRAAGK